MQVILVKFVLSLLLYSNLIYYEYLVMDVSVDLCEEGAQLQTPARGEKSKHTELKAGNGDKPFLNIVGVYKSWCTMNIR